MSSWIASVMILFRRSLGGALDSRGTLEAAQPFLEDAAALEARDQAPPGVRLLGGKGAGVYAGGRNRVTHRRFGRDHHIVSDSEVAGDADHAADHAAFADAGAAGDAGAGRDRRVRTDAHVVRDHDEIVELHALLDHRVLDGAAIDGGVGADLDVRADAHRAHLRHLEPGALLRGEAKAVRADHYTGLQHAARTDLHTVTERDARDEPHIGREARLGVELTVRTNEGTRSDGHARRDGGVWSHLCARVDARIRRDERGR